MTPDQVLGTWKAVSFTATTGDKVSFPLGEHPSGYIGFAANRFWVMLVDSARNPPAAAILTDAEAAVMMKSSAAYTGIYTINPVAGPDDSQISIHVDAAANEALAGTDRVFFARVDGNTLTLMSPAVLVPVTGQTSVVKLEFVRAN